MARCLGAAGIDTVYTLCGGHVAPVLVAAERQGLRVLDVRHEASAVFAADAHARLTGRPGVAVVTAGPGVTNSLTALQNAALAESPVLLLGGATATLLRGRGALQDIDQLARLRPYVKFAARAERVADLAPLVSGALRIARSGTPGPVFVELPLDLLYGADLVREWYGAGTGQGPAAALRRAWLHHHTAKILQGSDQPAASTTDRETDAPAVASRGPRQRAARLLTAARRPVLLVGSHALAGEDAPARLAAVIEALGVPVYLSGMARGLLGRDHPLLLRHRRRETLRAADLVLLAGVPLDFRLDYGRQIPARTPILACHREAGTMGRNRRPRAALIGAPRAVLEDLLRRGPAMELDPTWLATRRQADAEREVEIAAQAAVPVAEGVSPLALMQELDSLLDERATLIVDGGDFAATAAYTLRPRTPLSWLDPGVFGTLGVGGGFALAARACRPESEVWLLWGDGSAGFSIAEVDSWVRHRMPVITLVGNDAGWTQIAREQIPLLGSATATRLAPTPYHEVARGWGAAGLALHTAADIGAVLREARQLAAAGRPVVVDVRLAPSDFRAGSISM